MTPFELRRWLSQLWAILWVVLSIAVLRVGYVAYTLRPTKVTYSPVPVVVDPPKSGPAAPPIIPKALIESLGMRPVPLPSELLAAGDAPPTPSSTVPAKPPVTHVYVAIQRGVARTEIRLNGVTLGHTPYVGEVTCRHGETLEFVLIPPQGVPRRSVHLCDRTEISISDKSPDPAQP